MNPLRRLTLAAAVPLTLLAACTEQDAASVDRAADSFARTMMILLLIGVFAFVLWALVLAGGIAAIIAGLRRRRVDPPSESADPATDKPEPRRLDTTAILLIAFGILLLLGASPVVITGAPTGSGTVTIPLPLLAGAVVLVWIGVRRRR